jgi:hypothetical protein
MRKALVQLTLCVGVLVVWVILSMFSPAWSVLGILVIPAVFLALVDLGRALRSTPSRVATILGVLVGLPQAVAGLVSMLAGIIIVAAFLFWPERGEGNNWVVLLVGPLLVVFGIWWLRDVF